ncbi:MAG: NAD(P)-dependent alcohol dehydrogenase [Micromonosporaceae bacterium]|nr:NAD(P)-dependent alcohol dehydrogenase [Micromonosporaceae bacterium]
MQNPGSDPNVSTSGRSSRASRRTLLSAALGAGAAVAATPILGTPAVAAKAPARSPALTPEDYEAHGYGLTSATSGMVPVTFTRRPLRDDDVFLDILYCGVCHSDIHMARGDWGPPVYPCVPGHEMVGRVRAVGRAVTKFKPGDLGGVGTYIDSCRTCANCKRHQEQYCLNNGLVMTYGGYGDTILYGGFSDRIVVRDRFVMKVPAWADLAATAPLLCAGVSTYSPMQHWKLTRGQRVGVIGIGGLGHVAVKLAAARGAEVYAFTTTPGKVADARKLGARQGILWTDEAALQELTGSLDLIISTVPKAYPMQQFVNLLHVDGTMINLGAMDELQGISGMVLAMGRRSIVGSMAGGTREMQQVVDSCVRHNCYPKVEIISVQDLDQAFDRVISKEVRYRFVVDLSTMSR